MSANEPKSGAARISVPATTANLGAAFDAVGLALQLHLTLNLRKLEKDRTSWMTFAGQDAHMVPTNESNLIWQTMTEVAERCGTVLPPFSLEVGNEIPITKGLGSSATATLAGAAAADFLCGLRLAPEDLLAIAAAKEGHPDNVAPALYGGLVASISGDRILCSRSEFPGDWTVVAVTPEVALETKRARAALPPQIPYAHAVYNVQRTAFLMSQLIHGRREGLREAMSDLLHQPYRSALLPGLGEILEMGDCEGLLGVALSGAGSTVVAFADSNEQAIGDTICSIFLQHGLRAQVRLLKADNHGLRVDYLD